MVSGNPTPPAAPARRARRRALLIAGLAAALLLLSLGGYTVFWFQAGKAVIAGIEEGTVERRAAGWFVVYDGLRVSGFPFAFQVELANPVVGHPAAQTWSWRANTLTVAARPWATRHLRYTLRDVQFTYNLRGLSRDVLFLAPEVAGTVDLRDGAIDGLTAAVEKPVLDLLALTGLMTATRLDLALRRPSDANIALAGSVAVSALGGPFELLQKLGAIEQAAAEIDLTGPLPSGGTPRERVARWRDEGGAIEARRFSLAWGSLRAEGDGTLTLDEDMRPLGAFGTRLRGLGDLLDRLVAAGLMNNRVASGVKLSVGLLAARTADGGVAVPVTMQFGKLSLGPIAVGTLEPLEFD